MHICCVLKESKSNEKIIKIYRRYCLIDICCLFIVENHRYQMSSVDLEWLMIRGQVFESAPNKPHKKICNLAVDGHDELLKYGCAIENAPKMLKLIKKLYEDLYSNDINPNSLHGMTFHMEYDDDHTYGEYMKKLIDQAEGKI